MVKNILKCEDAYESFPYSIYGETYNVIIETDRYTVNNRLAIELWTDEGEAFAHMTVNLPGAKCPEGCAYLDTNNLPGVEEFVRENDLAEMTGIFAQSGFCTYPLYRFNLDHD